MPRPIDPEPLTLQEIIDRTPIDILATGHYACRDANCTSWVQRDGVWWKHYHGPAKGDT